MKYMKEKMKKSSKKSTGSKESVEKPAKTEPKKVATSWVTIRQAVALIVKASDRGEMSLLLGPKTNGIVAGHMVPTGGHIEDTDLDAAETCERETKAEAGLRISGGVRVAELRVRIQNKKKKVIVQIFLYNGCSGRLKPDKLEFKWLKFYPFSEIPWKELVPGDEPWIRKVLLEGKRRLVTINCGRDRNDVRSVRMYPL